MFLTWTELDKPIWSKDTLCSCDNCNSLSRPDPTLYFLFKSGSVLTISKCEICILCTVHTYDFKKKFLQFGLGKLDLGDENPKISSRNLGLWPSSVFFLSRHAAKSYLFRNLTVESTPTGIVLRSDKIDSWARRNIVVSKVLSEWSYSSWRGSSLLLVRFSARFCSKLVLAFIADNYHCWVIR